MIKCCSKCGKEYPRTKEYFPSDKQNKDGLYYWCKKCHSAATTNWAKKNKQKIKEYQKKYYKTLKGYITHLVAAIKQRCTNPKASRYEYYGERGIKCKFTRQELYNWLISNKIDPRGLDIHRIDKNSNYTLDNIDFLTKSEHAKVHSGVKYTKKECKNEPM